MKCVSFSLSLSLILFRFELKLKAKLKQPDVHYAQVEDKPRQNKATLKTYISSSVVVSRSFLPFALDFFTHVIHFSDVLYNGFE